MQSKYNIRRHGRKPDYSIEVTATIKFSEGDLRELLGILRSCGDGRGWAKGFADEIEKQLNTRTR